MQVSVQTSTRQQSSGGLSPSMLNDGYRKGYTIPCLPYQEFGIVAKELWVKYHSKLRIVPGHDERTGELFRQNVNCDTYDEDTPQENYLSDTFYMCRTMSNFGERHANIIIDLPPNSPDRDKYDTSPLNYFQYIVSNAVKAPTKSKFKPLPVWSNWVDARMGTLPYPKISLLFQALAFEVNDRGFSDADGNPLQDEQGNQLPLMSLISISHKVSWAALVKMLVEPANMAKPLDAATNNKYGAMAEAEGNIIHFNSAVQATDKSRRYLRPSVQEASVSGFNPEPFDLPEDTCRELWVPWNKLLRFYTADEQLELIANEFGADTVNYIFSNNPRFSGLVIPEHIAAAGMGRYATGGAALGIQQKKPAAVPGMALGTFRAAKPAAPPADDYYDADDTDADVPPFTPDPAPAAQPAVRQNNPKSPIFSLGGSARAQEELQRIRAAAQARTQQASSDVSEMAAALLSDDEED